MKEFICDPPSLEANPDSASNWVKLQLELEGLAVISVAAGLQASPKSPQETQRGWGFARPAAEGGSSSTVFWLERASPSQVRALAVPLFFFPCFDGLESRFAPAILPPTDGHSFSPSLFLFVATIFSIRETLILPIGGQSRALLLQLQPRLPALSHSSLRHPPSSLPLDRHQRAHVCDSPNDFLELVPRARLAQAHAILETIGTPASDLKSLRLLSWGRRKTTESPFYPFNWDVLHHTEFMYGTLSRAPS